MALWGDGHTHSDWSDGLDTLQENTRLFQLYGEDFHFATDHLEIDVSRLDYRWEIDEWSQRLFRLHPGGLAAYQSECARASSPQHVTLPGLELIWANAAEGQFGAPADTHVLVREHLEQLPAPAFFRNRSLRAILYELQARGMRPFLAHIHDGIPWETLDGTEIAGLEMRYDIEQRESPFSRRRSLAQWDHWLSQGHHLPLSSGSDCHQMDLWAGSAMRNVVAADELSPAAVRRALHEGRSYLSATWHPDLYRRLGYEGIAPQSGGFTPWWLMAGAEACHDRPAMKEAVERMIATTLQDGRVRREYYPTLSFAVDGRGPGSTTEARDNCALAIEVRMNVPVRQVRLIGQGEVRWQEELASEAQVFTLATQVSMRGSRYVRLEAWGSAGNGQDEYLLSNPIYLV